MGVRDAAQRELDDVGAWRAVVVPDRGIAPDSEAAGPGQDADPLVNGNRVGAFGLIVDLKPGLGLQLVVIAQRAYLQEPTRAKPPQ
jgi:hypothetical protein